MDLFIDKLKQFLDIFKQYPILGFVVAGILIFIASNGDGQVESGKGFLIIIAILIIMFSLGAFSIFTIWG